MRRAGAFRRAGDWCGAVTGRAVLAHDERHLRRRTIRLDGGAPVHVDLAEAVALEEGDALLLDDGGLIGIVAAEEALYEVGARDARHLAELAWHLGNRHLPARIEAGRILILRDPVIAAMLGGLGAHLREVSGPFVPVRGAYASGHGHHHADAAHHG